MKQTLSYNWKFLKGFKKDYINNQIEGEMVDIPHAPVEVNYNCFNELDYQGIFTYEKMFNVDVNPNNNYFLEFEGFMLQGDIYLNGNNLGHYISGYLPVKIDITKFIKKENRLVVKLDSNEDPNIPPFGFVVDYLTFAGIYRPVYLITKPKEYIKSVQIISSTLKELEIKVETTNNEKKVLFELFDKDNNLVKSFTESKIDSSNFIPWDINNPYLYTLKVKYVSDEESLKVGFRSLIADKSGFYINGKKTKLIGLNRHQIYPYVGPSLPRSAQEEDADIIKYQLGCNIVRCSHYSQSEAFLSRCDEIGLLVQTEVPGWQFVSKESEWRNNFLDFIKRMVLKEQNHPSLFAYGIRVDESPDDNELYSKAQKIVKSIDPNRYTTGVRNFKDSNCIEDFYSYNDFSCSDISHGLDSPKSVKGKKNKPYLVTENMGHMYPNKMYDIADRRCEAAKRHLKVINDAYKYDSLMGEIGWCAFDYNTHPDFGSGERICYHGVCDMFRNLKASGYAYQSQLEDKPYMHLCNTPVQGDSDEAKTISLFVVTNCDYIKFYKNGHLINTFYPDKKTYPNLKYPPITIDDYVGDLFDEGYSKKDSKRMVKTLNYIAINGMNHIKISKVLGGMWVAFKHHLNMQKLSALYNKYISGWGDSAKEFTLVGFKDNQEVIKQKLSSSTSFDLDINTYKNVLENKETYDVSRVSLILKDQNGLQEYYAMHGVEIITQGPIDIIGPRIISLHGGSTSFYVRSKVVSKEEKASVIIKVVGKEYKVNFIIK